ncbi:MAG: MotA/TolQ/ExbB proton channel family protein [Ignavibacteriae bacterium]|nr:MAG: MotA/TolQ/ExbB proton channel family protein [Ignavibacteriota bacterium]
MKTSTFNAIVIVLAFVFGWVIFEYMLPSFIKEGGPLVISLIALVIMLIAVIVERWLTLKKANGKSSLTVFLKNVQQAVNSGDIDAALAACDKQRGSCANVLRAGLEKYKSVVEEGDVKGQKELMESIQHSIEEATMLEVPMLERNLSMMSTIASIGTMVGLLGTVIGMIRSFQAMGRAGAPDAVQLAIGISEALINTAGGLVAGIGGIVAYNFFVTKIDNFTYMIDEASYSIIQSLASRRPHKK